MLHSPLLISPSPAFWSQAVAALLNADHALGASMRQGACDFSGYQVVVPRSSHMPLWRRALVQEQALTRPAFIPPRINTMEGWLAMQEPESEPVGADSERLMQLYAQLREHAWLKKMFGARRSADLLPLAQTLLVLSDELTQAALPGLVEARWETALAQLPAAARNMLSDEAQLVWSIWKSQLDGHDKTARRHARMLALAQAPVHGQLAGLIWIASVPPDPMEQAFLEAWGQHAEVQPLLLDWRGPGITRLYQTAWPELCAQLCDSPPVLNDALEVPTMQLSTASSLEEAAQQGALIVLDWLQQGKQDIAIVAQDRLSARRLRALLERAEVLVADETGWKLSTTRAAAALAGWCDVVSSRGATTALLDLLKSPFIFAGMADKAEAVMQIESQLRRQNIAGEWSAILAVCNTEATACIKLINQQAAVFEGRKSLQDWSDCVFQLLDALDMRGALEGDSAGRQVLELLQDIGADSVRNLFSFAEWRALLNLQFDARTFMPLVRDKRVLMLPLSSTRLRNFDAVLVLGADARHLPSQPQETLFFSNAVRHELGLPTRQSHQHQQLRDFTELLCANREVVLSWQTHKDGEPNPLSPWLERLQLCLAKAGMAPLRLRHQLLPLQRLQAQAVHMPRPSAPALLPSQLTASGYRSLLACPYQFFALRMLRVSVMDELSDLPEKRDYGTWLHAILQQYHATVRDQKTPQVQRAELLATISKAVFDQAIRQHPAALAYAARWQKVMPAYLRWDDEHEQSGWHFACGEEALQHTLEWPGGSVELRGRLDRIDENSEGERIILDYKTSPLMLLANRLKDGEDQQLPFYGLLAGQTMAAAHYVALEMYKDKTGAVAAPDFEQQQHRLQQQIVSIMQAVAQGASLPANGIEATCQYCEVRGLCRKGVWQ